MFLRKRTARTYLRYLALLLVGFQVLSSGRALVPNLCLTQRDAAQAAAATAAAHQVTQTMGSERPSCCEPAPRSCCSEPGKHAPGGAPGKPTGDNPKCPFCFVAKAFTEPPLVFLHPFWQELADAPCEQGPGTWHSRPADNRTLGRAPPFLSA